MPRQKNALPTSIYWLYDIRPEKVAVFGPEGCPFYCGKTVQPPKVRFRHHRSFARRSPERASAMRIIACGIFIRYDVVEVVPFGDDWVSREKAWIVALRATYPTEATNISDGGESQTQGWKHKPETLVKIGAVHRGKKFSPERCAQMSAERKGCIISAETRVKISAANKGHPVSAEARAKMSAKQKGRVKTAETCAKISAALKYRGPAIAAANRQRVWTEASRAKLSATMLRRHAEARS